MTISILLTKTTLLTAFSHTQGAHSIISLWDFSVASRSFKDKKEDNQLII